LVTKYHLISYILVFYILSPCGQSTDYPHFLFPFPLAHSTKRQPCVAWLTVFREKSRWKPAQAYCKQAHNTLAFPVRMECSLKDERKQALFPCFPICKSSSLCSPPAGTAVFIISIGKGSYVFFTTSQGQAVPVWRKIFPATFVARYFLPKTLQTLNTTLLSLCETKTTDPTGRRIKKKSDLRETGKKFSETSTPSPLKSA